MTGRSPEPDQPTAPPDWAWHGFPLTAHGDERLSLEWASQQGVERIRMSEAIGDHAVIGPVLHWAHLLKAYQGPDGRWPCVVNARTGSAIGASRTTSPVCLLARLGELLQSSEFDAAIEAARAVVFVDSIQIGYHMDSGGSRDGGA